MSIKPYQFRCLQCHKACDPSEHICKEITKRDKMVGRQMDSWELIDRMLGLECDLVIAKQKNRDLFREGVIRAILSYGPAGIDRKIAESMADHSFMKDYDEQRKGE